MITTKGFSLLELIVAIAIFSLGSLAAGYLILDASITSRLGVELSEATSVAREGIEAVGSIRDASYTAMPTGASLSLRNVTGLAWSLDGSSDIQLSKYTRIISISKTVTGTSSQYYAVVTSTVNWLNARNATDTVNLVTRFTNWRNP